MDKDMVEVIRCKDCRFCATTEELVKEGILLPEGENNLWCDVGFYRVTEDEYCSKALRKK